MEDKLKNKIIELNEEELENIDGGVIPAILRGLSIYGGLEATFGVYDKIKLAYSSYRKGFEKGW